jgi:hypothetical protein
MRTPENTPMHFDPPPEHARRLRCGVFCGVEGHPKIILEAFTERELAKAEEEFSCPVCQGSDWQRRIEAARLRRRIGAGSALAIRLLGHTLFLTCRCTFTLQQELRAPIAPQCPRCGRNWRR